MKINITRILLGVVLAFSLGLSACKDDEEPEIAGISFEADAEEVTESDGSPVSFHPLIWESISGLKTAMGREVKVKIALDRPMPETSVISYSIAGTATRNSSSAIGDFEVNGNNITIEKGASEAFISITLFEDTELEYDDASLTENEIPYETIVITLESVVSGSVKLTDEKKTYTLKVLEDDVILGLDWNIGNDNDHGDVDMDLFLWLDGELLTNSATPGNDPEFLSIPAGLPNGTYGMSYTYYSGSSNAVFMSVGMLNFGGTLNGATNEVEYTKTMTLDNVNRYDASEEGSEGHENYKGQPMIIQTMEKNGLNYTNISEINLPESGSRMGSTTSVGMFKNFKRGEKTKPMILQKK